MAPVISSKLWQVGYERLMGNVLNTDWFVDTFWDVIAQTSKLMCNTTGILGVNAAPVRHMNCNSLFKNTKCFAYEPGPGGEKNARNVTSSEADLARQALA